MSPQQKSCLDAALRYGGLFRAPSGVWVPFCSQVGAAGWQDRTVRTLCARGLLRGSPRAVRPVAPESRPPGTP